MWKKITEEKLSVAWFKLRLNVGKAGCLSASSGAFSQTVTASQQGAGWHMQAVLLRFLLAA